MNVSTLLSDLHLDILDLGAASWTTIGATGPDTETDPLYPGGDFAGASRRAIAPKGKRGFMLAALAHRR